MTNNIVLTGPPSAGKSTLMREISALGYQTVPETARMEIERMKNSRSGMKIKNESSKRYFQNRITQRRLAAESANGIDTDETVVLDRSLIDNIAYREYLGVTTPEYLYNLAEGRYDTVVFLEGLPLEKDGIRFDSEEDQRKIGMKLEYMYQDYEPEVNYIEVDSIDTRLDEIISVIQ